MYMQAYSYVIDATDGHGWRTRVDQRVGSRYH